MRTSPCLSALVLCLASACHQPVVQPPSTVPGDASRTTSTFERWQIIGEGTDFLAVQIECPGECAALDRLSALALDSAGLPVRRITSLPQRPHAQQKNVIWFFLVLFDPTGAPAHLRESHGLRFTLRTDQQPIEKTVAYAKTWGSGEPRIFDAPLPPEAIPGLLVLCDYVFMAQGDPRSPSGSHVAARIHGSGGRWDQVEVVSDVLGAEAPPEVRLETDRGWLELETGRSHSMREAVAPARPYVEGWWDGKGCFHPDPPQVH